MVKQFPEFRRQVDNTTRRPLAEAHSPGGTGRPCMALDSRTPTPEKGARARSCETLSRTIPGTRSARPRRVTTEPEATGEPEGRLGVGSLFPVPLPDEVFGHRGAPCRAEPVAVEKRRAGITTLGRLRGTPAAGNSFFSGGAALNKQAAAPGPRLKPETAGLASRPPET
jgi:hypothetical protein